MEDPLEDEVFHFDDEFAEMRKRMLAMMTAFGRPAITYRYEPASELCRSRSVDDELVDIIEEERSVRVVLPLPGVAEEDIEVRAHGRTMEVVCSKRSFRKTVVLPCAVRSSGCRKTYRNGVLEVRMPRPARRDLSQGGPRMREVHYS